ncbi:hypothetical protein [Parvibaculum sp. MBR-TMA-1.3b-4.2]|jgi:hypothetical protein
MSKLEVHARSDRQARLYERVLPGAQIFVSFSSAFEDRLRARYAQLVIDREDAAWRRGFTLGWIGAMAGTAIFQWFFQ